MDADDVVLSSTLLETELRRLAVCVDLAQIAVTHLLDRFDLVETGRAVAQAARRRLGAESTPPAGAGQPFCFSAARL